MIIVSLTNPTELIISLSEELTNGIENSPSKLVTEPIEVFCQ